MSTIVVCPECERKLKVPETAAGKSIRCPGCKSIIPAANENNPPPSAIATTKREAAPPPPQWEAEEEERAGEEPERAVRKKSKRKKSSTGLILGLALGGAFFVLLVGGSCIGLIVYKIRSRTIPDSEWQTFAPPQGDCTVLLPGSAPENISKMMNGVFVNKFQVKRQKEGALFLVAFSNLDSPTLPVGILDLMTHAERDNLINAMKGSQATSETPIAQNGATGREIQLSVADSSVFIMRIYLVKIGNQHRVFQLVAAGRGFTPDKGDAGRFFESFKITAPFSPPAHVNDPVVQKPQPPSGNPPRPNPPRPNRPNKRPKKRSNQPAAPGERATWDETSGTQTLCLAFSPDRATLAVGVTA